jgi:GNAT superfamily N-acetyltransferase
VTDEIRPLERADLPDAARALALAFQDDPVLCWCFPHAGRRASILGRGFRVFLERLWFEHGGCFATDDLTGAACWTPPGQWKVPIRRQLTVASAMLSSARGRAPWFLWLSTMMESNHPDSQPHWYLPVLGVEPARQGRGLGSKLMHPILTRCDSERLGAYLEATSPRNLALYERHVFEVTGELRLPRGGPPLWQMWRDPA